MVCGGTASRSQRIAGPRGDGASRVMVGSKDLYEARCRFCHEPYENADQGELGLTVGPPASQQSPQEESTA
jgi:thymidine kinase